MSQSVAYYRTINLQGVFSAALLVTDPGGVPQEFKYVVPVVPDELHRHVYGTVLESYLRTSLLKDRLLEAMESSPVCLVTNWDEWTLSDNLGDFDYLAIRSENPGQRKFVPDALQEPFYNRLSANEVVMNSRYLRPIRVRFPFEDPRRQEKLIEILLELDETMELTEPLERLENALHHICQHK